MRKLAAKIFVVGILISTLLVGCNSNNSANVDGKFFGYHNQPIVVEKTMPGIDSKIIDTLSTGADGEFSFTVKFEDKNPLFVNIHTTDSYVPLLLTPGENVNVSSIGNFYNNYKVEGSIGSQDLRLLNMTTVDQIKSLDSLYRVLENGVESNKERELSLQYAKGYINLKRDVIKFVISNPSSLASIVPLYQPMVSGRYIFDEPSDIVYFRTIADSLSKKYPTSPYVISLRADVEKSDDMVVADSSLQKSLNSVQEVNLPPLQLKDAEGQMRKLTDLVGKKVVLLDFTSLLNADLKLRNREMVELYEKYNDKGFEIYQVSVDENRAQWLSAVVNARLRWISVNDFMGTKSPALSLFNVQKIPTNYLIDLKGNIVARDLTTAEKIETELKKLL